MGVRKCVICGQIIKPTDETVPYKKRHAHVQCFNNVMKITTSEKRQKVEEKKKTVSTTKPKKVQYKDAVTEEEYQEKQRFYSIIKQIMKTEILEPKIYKLAEDYVNKYGFTYDGMTRCMDYITRVLEMAITGDGMGLIPYYYAEAEKHAQTIAETREKNKDLTPEITDNFYEKCSIRIKKKRPKIKQINIEEIGCDS